MRHYSLLDLIGDFMLCVLYILLVRGGYSWLRWAWRELRRRDG